MKDACLLVRVHILFSFTAPLWDWYITNNLRC